MKKVLFQLILAVLAVSSCATAKYYGGFTPEAARQDMVLLGPVSSIYYLDEKSHASFNDTLSVISETLIAGLVDELRIPVSGRVELNDDEKEEAAAFFKYLDGPEAKHRDTFAIPGVLDEAIEAQGCRYGLLLIARGMTRDIKGYRKDVAKGVFLGIATTLLTLGTVTMYSTPKKASSELFALVLDAETNRVVFYNTNGPQSTDPLQANPVSGQLSGLLKDYMK